MKRAHIIEQLQAVKNTAEYDTRLLTIAILDIYRELEIIKPRSKHSPYDASLGRRPR